MNAVCLVFDRLHAGYVGAYGNSWINTPTLDRLAAGSLLFDRALVDSPDLDRLIRSYWQGLHAMCPETESESARPSLPALLGEAGVATALMTDEPRVARHRLAGDFDEVIEIEPPWRVRAASAVERTHFARCFLRLIDWLEAARGPFCLWCHFGALGTTWDAPPAFRQAYREEGDPPPPDGAVPPDRRLADGFDPDELLGVVQSYAGQVTLLDTCLGAFLDFYESLPTATETLLALTAARGFPLGEHGRVGACDGALFGELLHVPWMIQFPDDAGAAVRRPHLIEPADLWATLLDWWHVAAPASPTAESLLPLAGDCFNVRGGHAERDRLCILGSDGQKAIRTPAWYLREHAEPELFAKPDDRWEVNNVAARCPEVVECLRDALRQFEQTLPAGRAADLPPLADVLLRGL